MNTTPSTVETTTTTRPWTLADIAESQGVQKRAAQNWLKLAKVEHGDIGELVGTTRYFSLLERDLLASYAAPPRPVKVETFPEFADTAPAPAPMTVYEGNHRGSLDLPKQPESLDLGELRGDEAALSSFEAEDIERFLDACDGFLGAVDADYQKQLATTQRKEQAAAKVRSKVGEVKEARLKYQMRSESLSIHNRGIDAELKEGLATLGKPAADTAAPGA
jgi:hypothetical protein